MLYWYKITTQDGSKEPYTWVGSSNETMDGLAQKAARGEYIHINDLLYRDRGEMKEWSHWDKSLEPEIYLNPAFINTIMRFKGDPRITPDR
ncbi:MAG: hypothetical protein KA403_08560 [Candidatus Omnitrophica bacterium]|nr:hypothetical protein [Candidatus Omnitrophota bacterium]